MRILHVIERVGSGGAFNGTMAAARHSIRENGCEHTVLSLLPPLAEFAELAEAVGMNVVYPRSLAERDLHLERADIVQVEWWNNPAIKAFIDSPLPPCRVVPWLRVNGASPAHPIPAGLLSWADHVMLCCPMLLDAEPLATAPLELRRTKVSVLFAGAELDHLPRGVQREKAPGAPFDVGYVGTVDLIKLHPGYLRMSAAVRVPDVRFVVCGEGPLAAMEAEADALGAADRIRFRGFVADIGPLLADFDVFGYPLCKETYAAAEKSLQEAMFVGVPPVVFPHGGIKDMVIDGKTGCVVRSEAEYTQAIEHLYLHPEERRRLGRNAHEWASSHFGARRQTQKLLQIYEKVVKTPKRPRRGAMRPPPALGAGAEAFVSSLRPDEAAPFRAAAANGAPAGEKAAERSIAASAAPVIFVLGKYHEYYPRDPLLTHWHRIASSAGRPRRTRVAGETTRVVRMERLLEP